MTSRSRPPYQYKHGTVDEPLDSRLIRLHENALEALAEVIQQAAENGAEAGIRWAMNWLEETDSGEGFDFVAYEQWRQRANWPSDLQPAGRNDVWPVDPHCRAINEGHYCTLAEGHRGDHVTLTARWAAAPAPSSSAATTRTPTP